MKKRFLTLILTIAAMLTSIFGFSACGEESSSEVGSGTSAEQSPSDDSSSKGDSLHEHDYTSVVTVPTCTERGFTTYTCVCGDSYIDTYVKALGHDYPEEGTIVSEPTCLTTGIESFVCSRCEETKEETIAALGHSWKTTWAKDDSYHWIECNNCEEKKDNGIHNYANGSSCGVCGQEDNSSQGLEYRLSDSGTYYVLWNVGECSDTNVIIASSYNGKPVKTISESAFYENRNMTSVSIPQSVTKIEPWAFYGCTSLTSITISDNVTSIGEGAFQNCRMIDEIHFGRGMNKIEKNLFGNCSALSNITIPDSVTSIGSNAFSGCSRLTSITIPDSVTSIGDSAFSGCSSLTEMTLPFVGGSKKTANSTYQYPFGYIFGTSNYMSGKATKQYYYGSSVSSTTNSTYYLPTSLKEITITGGNILYGAFSGCSGLTSIEILDSVTSIGNSAFSGCSSLTSIEIPDSVVSIGNSAFYDCSSLTGITIGDSVMSIGSSAFYGCNSLMSVYITDIANWCNISGLNNLMAYYQANDKKLYLDNELITGLLIPNNVISIADYAFYSCIDLTSVKIGDNVTTIGDYAFSSCSGLTSVIIPNSVTTIGDYAFSSCSGLTNMMLPDSVTNIGEDVFRNCSSLESISVDVKNPSYASEGGVLYNKEKSQIVLVPLAIKTVVLPDTVTSIGKEAFYNCSVLTKVDFGDNSQVASIGNYAFFSCSSLTEVVIPDSVTSIGQSAFYNCSGLREIIIPDSVTSIGQSAFYNCSGLTEIIIPDSVTTIGNSAFYGCSGLVEIIIPDSVILLGTRPFYNCSSLENVEIGTGVISISSDVFSGCSVLQSITIPFVGAVKGGTSNTHFGYIFGASSYSYNDSYVPKSLKEVTITGGVIKSDAFYNCSSLTNITVGENVSSIQASTFSGCSNLIEMTLPFVGATKDGTSNTHFGYIFGARNYSYNDDCVPSSLKKVTITGGTISAYAFYNCDSLTSVTIGDKVTSIGEKAFYNCTSLTEMTLPFVGESKNATGYKSVFGYIFGYQASSSTFISGRTYQFYDNKTNNNYHYYIPTTIKKVTMTGGSINANTFYNCSGLTSVVIGETVTSIGETAFYNCSNLKEIVLSSDITSIGDRAFYNCSNLKEILLPSNITSIGDRAFYNCSSLKEIIIPENVVSIGVCALGNCSSLENISVDAQNPNYVSESGVLYNKEKSEILRVSVSLETLTIPNSVISIGDYAFSGCSDLTRIVVPDNVTSIGDFAFYGCTGLTEMTLPFVGEGKNATGYKSVFGYIFGYQTTGSGGDYHYHADKYYRYCIPDSLRKVTITGGVIGDKAFYKCNNLTKIIIPSSLTLIGNDAFNGCNSLKELIIPKSITSIGSSAFYNCSGLTEIVIPDSVTSIGAFAFYNCSGLTIVYITDIAAWWNISFGGYGANPLCYAKKLYLNNELVTKLEIPNTVTEIKSYAFSNCSSLTSIKIPESVTSIGEYAFSNCDNLTSVYYTGDIASWCNITGLSSLMGNNVDLYIRNELLTGELIIPDGVTSIGDYAFYNCSRLTSITIPNSVTSIGASAFSGCSSLTSIKIPESVTSIGSSAFYGCSNLTEITLPFVGATKDGAENTHFGYIFGANSYVPISLRKVTITGNSISSSAFYNCRNLTSIIIGNSVTSIGDSAFSGCSGLKSIAIPDSVTSIGKFAFYNCNGLLEMTLPFVGATKDGAENTHFGYVFGASSYSYNSSYVPSSLVKIRITSGAIGSYAFHDCNNLTRVEIGDDVTSIGYDAFYDCSNLKSVKIGAGVKSIGSYAFSGVSTSLTDIYITDIKAWCNIYGLYNLMSYGSNAKYLYLNNELVTELEIPNTVTEIKAYTFSYFVNLKSITISNGVTSICSYAFYNCSSLMSITIPDSVTSIGDSAFSGCSSLTEMTLPFAGESKETTGYQSVFGYIFGYETSSSSSPIDGATYQYAYSYSSYPNVSYNYYHYYIPTSLRVVTITGDSIGSRAFYNCSNLTSVKIGDGVTSIGEYAFYNCSNLTSVKIGESVTSIGSSAFSNCDNLTSIYYTGDIASWCNITGLSSLMGNNVDLYIRNELLTGELIIPDGVTSIGDYAFYNCSRLTSITIPNSVTSIGRRVFYNCSSLMSVKIGDNVTTIGDSAFSNCDNLTSVYYTGDIANWCNITGLSSLMGNNVDLYIHNELLTGELIIPDGVTSIGDYAFYNCSRLTSITIPNSVTSIGRRVFYNCSSLMSVKIGDNVTTIGDSAFYGCGNLTSITIPDNITSIGEGVFYGCNSLTEMTLPFVGESKEATGYESVFGYIFGANSYVPISLKKVTITGNSINSYAFYDCSSLASIEIGAGVTSIGDNAFYNCSSLTNVCITDIEVWCNISFGNSYANPLYYAKNLYLNNELVTDLVIPDTVLGIKSYAFYNCDSLTSVVIGDSVTSIGDYAFYDCDSLTSVTIGDRVETIDSHVFYDCSWELKSITFSDTSTWYRTTNFTNWTNKTGGTQISVTDSSTNAENFKSPLYDYYWYKL